MSAALDQFQLALTDGDFSKAAKLFCTFPLNEQEAILQQFAQSHQNAGISHHPASKAPKILAVLQRQLKDDISFEDFYQAWQPPRHTGLISAEHQQYDYYPIPVRVINARNIDEPEKLISISMIACDDDDTLVAAFTQCQQDEAERAAKIAEVADKIFENELYEVVSDDILGA